MPLEIQDLVESSKKQSLLVKNYAAHIRQRTAAMRQEFIKIADEMAGYYEENQELADTSGAELQKQVLKYIDTEIVNLAAFDKARTEPGASWLYPQISSHKLSFTLPKIRTMLTGEDHESTVVNLARGRFKSDDSFFVEYPLLRTNSFFGSTAATYAAGMTFCVRFATSNKNIGDYAKGSLAHISPSSSIPGCFINSGSRFSVNLDGITGLGFYHAGYAFGGQRGEPVQYTLGPEDCSSLLANVIQQTTKPGSKYAAASMQTSTIHQLYAWRDRQHNDKMFIDRRKDGYSQEIATYWNSILELDTPNADLVKAGDIYLLRTALKAKGDFDAHATGGGHTGVVIGENPSDPTKVLIFECARDLEGEKIDLEYPENTIWGVGGVGIGSFNKRYDEQTDDRIKRNMFLQTKLKLSI
jgi:hypothetical protein